MDLALGDAGDGEVDDVGVFGPGPQHRDGVRVADVGDPATQGLQGFADGDGAGRAIGFPLVGHQHVEPGDDDHVAGMVQDVTGGLGAVISGQVRSQGKHAPFVVFEDDVFDCFRCFRFRGFSHCPAFLCFPGRGPGQRLKDCVVRVPLVGNEHLAGSVRDH